VRRSGAPSPVTLANQNREAATWASVAAPVSRSRKVA
jgi:hypothetical protein